MQDLRLLRGSRVQGKRINNCPARERSNVGREEGERKSARTARRAAGSCVLRALAKNQSMLVYRAARTCVAIELRVRVTDPD